MANLTGRLEQTINKEKVQVMQKTLQTSLGILGLAAAVAAFGSSTARADSPQPASGDFAVEDLVPTFAEQVGGISFIELTATFLLEGTLEGAFVADFSIIHLGALNEPARQIFIAEGTFEGKVDGASGSFDFVFVGDIDAEGFAEGELVILRGTDELANLSGHITLAGLAGVAGGLRGRSAFRAVSPDSTRAPAAEAEIPVHFRSRANQQIKLENRMTDADLSYRRCFATGSVR